MRHPPDITLSAIYRIAKTGIRTAEKAQAQFIVGDFIRPVFHVADRCKGVYRQLLTNATKR
jgi:hypothetical protein